MTIRNRAHNVPSIWLSESSEIGCQEIIHALHFDFKLSLPKIVF